MFERDTVNDGNPGEFELWVKNEKLDQEFPFPMGWMDVRMNDKGVLGSYRRKITGPIWAPKKRIVP